MGGREVTYLLVHNNAQPGFALDNSIRHTHLPAQSWQEDDQLDRIHVVWNEHQARLLVLNQSHHVIEPVLHSIRLLADILLLLTLADRGGFLEQPLLLLGFGFWLVFVEELEGLGGGVAVEHVGKLRDRRGDFEAEIENFLLAL